MGDIPPQGDAGNQGSEFHYPVVGRHDRKAPAPRSLAPDRSGKRTIGIHLSPAWDTGGTGGGVRVLDPPEDSQKQSLDEELGIQDVTNINESWYPPTEAELASAIESIRDKSQPMDVDPAPTEHLMPHDDEPELLGMAAGSDSLVTAREDRVLDTPARFSRALGDRRLTPESSTGATGHRITGHIE